MTGLIPQPFIDDLLNRVDIVDIIDSRVALKKAGQNFTACCPFHNEKTPSFTVSQSKQFYHCFGCGANGSAIGFLMEYEHLSFPESIEELASIVGLEVPRETGQHSFVSKEGSAPAPGLLEILSQASRYYQDQLRHHPQAKTAIDYLKKRGLSGEIAARFGIGFAPPGWENLASLLRGDADRLKGAEELGLLIDRDDGSRYDRFRDRIMFPITDRRGRVIGFGGRVMGDEKPKYMNSPESVLFHKGKELYGLFEARKAERNLGNLLVVEGYMDVVALAQSGINNAIATLGTATTAEHLERIFRIVPEVFFCFDGDAAGRKAAWKALENCMAMMRQGREARFLFIPDGEDPDSLVRKEGAEGFRKRLENALPLSEFFYAELSGRVNMSSMDGRAHLAELAKPLLNHLPDDLFREMMLNRLAELTQLEGGFVRQRILARGDSPGSFTPRKPQQKDLSPVRQAIQFLLHFPVLAQQVDMPPGWQELDIPGIPLLIDLLRLAQENPGIQTGAIIERWRGQPEARHLSILAGETLLLSDEYYQVEFEGALELLYKRHTESRINELRLKAFAEMSAAEKQELVALMQKKPLRDG
ncbi:MAG: DNA primase [Gammaproteobacteria bacterium]